MIITRKNKIGGRPLSGYPFEEDPDTGYLGRKVGYCGGCNHPLLIRTIDLKEVLDTLGEGINKPARIPFKHKLIKYLGGHP